MRDMMRRLFAPLLDRLEAGEGQYAYGSRIARSSWLSGRCSRPCPRPPSTPPWWRLSSGGVFPAAVFFLLGLVCEVVAFLGSDR